MIIETTKVTRNTDFIVAEDTENEMEIAVDTELVDDFEKKAQIDECEAAVLLATVEKSRMLSSSTTRIDKKIRESDLLDGLCVLITRFGIQTICDILDTMKYCEIKQIMRSDNPVEELEEYI